MYDIHHRKHATITTTQARYANDAHFTDDAHFTNDAPYTKNPKMYDVLDATLTLHMTTGYARSY